MGFPPVRTVYTRKAFDEALQELQTDRFVGLDTETTGLDWWRCKLVGVSAATKRRAFYFPFAHERFYKTPMDRIWYPDPFPNLPLAWLPELREALLGRIWVGANLNFDLHVLARYGWPDGQDDRFYHDVTIGAYTFDENQDLKLEALASRYLKLNAYRGERLLFRELAKTLGIKKAGSKHKGYLRHVHPDKAGVYAGYDAYFPRVLLPLFRDKLQADRTWQVYRNLLQYQRALHRMEAQGLPVLPQVLKQEWKNAARDREKVLIWGRQKHQIENIGSSTQVCKYLGLESSDKKNLSDFIDDTPEDDKAEFAQEVLRYRRLDKACGTYYKGISKACVGPKMHPTLKLTGAVVRLSAQNPNTQSIPRKGKAEYQIKAIFGHADPDLFVLEADLSQAEIVMGAHLTGDPTLTAAILEGLDLHQAMRDQIQETFGRDVERVIAKAVNFSAQYGVGPGKLAKILRVSVADAAKMLHAHHKLYPKLTKSYHIAQKLFTRQKYLALWSGRKRHWGPDVKEHAALNNLIQGGVSELMRVAIIRLEKHVPELRMGLTVHDCVVGTIHRRDLRLPVIERIQHHMSDFPWLRVPIKADVEIGRTWEKVKPWKEALELYAA